MPVLPLRIFHGHSGRMWRTQGLGAHPVCPLPLLAGIDPVVLVTVLDHNHLESRSEGWKSRWPLTFVVPDNMKLHIWFPEGRQQGGPQRSYKGWGLFVLEVFVFFTTWHKLWSPGIRKPLYRKYFHMIGSCDDQCEEVQPTVGHHWNK